MEFDSNEVMSLYWTIGLKARPAGRWLAREWRKGFDGGGQGLKRAGRYDDFLRILWYFNGRRGDGGPTSEGVVLET
jgi:hypothetical protein